MLRRTHAATQTNPDDIDESKYTAQKKLSEVVAHLGDAINKLPEILNDEEHVIAFYQFAIEVFRSNSLLVSIPVLHSLSQTLAVKQPRVIGIIQQGASQMFDNCVERLIRFESIPKDTEHPILSYLHEDFETLPEMHAFLGNYRRYCMKIIEYLSEERPVGALEYMLQQTVAGFKEVTPLIGPSYSRHAIPVAQLEANCAAFRGGLSGYRRWLISKATTHSLGAFKPEHQQEVTESTRALSDQCMSISTTGSEHPDVVRTACQLMVDIVLHVPNPDASLIRGVFHHILKCKSIPSDYNTDFDEALRQLESTRLHTAQHLAISFPDIIYEQHQEVSRQIDLIWHDDSADDKIRWGYRAILVILTQRSLQLDESTRLVRVKPMLEPIISAWNSQELTNSLQSFQSFCSLMGMDNLMGYVKSTGFHTTEDWSSAVLDSAGSQLRDGINASLSALPVRMTTSLLMASSDGVKENSTAYRVGARLWQEIIPLILPNVLALLSHATAFSSEKSWSQFPVEFQNVMRRMLIDRFWQSGISNETRDEFTARVSGSSNTYEGFGSTVRGSPRQLRDGCYHIIHGMTRFEKIFYDIPNLAEPLAAALFDIAHWLSTHHLQRSVSLLDRLVTSCPPSRRRSFLPPLISRSFTCFHTKLSREWEAVEAAREDNKENDAAENLNEEMKADSVVRATTHSFISFAHKMLSNVEPHNEEQSFRAAFLTNQECSQSVVDFLVASLRMRDSRCVTIATQIFRSIIPFVMHQQDPDLADLMSVIRYRIAADALQTAIMSLNEPHFVDIHKDLAALIASIIHHMAPHDGLPLRILESLQGIDPVRVQHAVDGIIKSKREREQRAIVLDLLEGIRGIRISEMGKVGIGGNREDAALRAKRDKDKWTDSGGMEIEKNGIVRGNTPIEGEIGNLFGDH